MKQPRFLLENGAEVFRCGSFGLWGCSPHAPGNIGCCIPHGALLSRKVSRVCKGCSWIWGLTSPPCPRVNAGRLIPKDAPSGIKPAHLRKESCPLQGLTPPPLPRVNAGRLIPNDALTGIKSAEIFYEIAPISFRKRRRGFWVWGLMPPPHPGSGRATPSVRSAQDLRTFL